MIHFIVVNLNGLKYTVPLVDDLKNQSAPYLATIYDQCSRQPGTIEFLSELEHPISYIRNRENIPLNRLWNSHYERSDAPFLCFLNNDVRISSNFASDTLEIFKLEPDVGCVIHTTNHPEYRESYNLDYVVLDDKKTVQGWDFTFRREAYTVIPDDLETYGGDDFLFTHLYKDGWKVAVALSSPVKHFYARTRRYYQGDRRAEAQTYAKYGYKRLYMCRYSRRFPTW